MRYQGLFVSIEGCDGCGKTTALKKILEKLQEKGINPLVTREPGGSRIAEDIRNIILDKRNTEEDSRTEALLYAASRRQHLVEIVLPALKEGRLVISDRYIDSSLAYQGYARGIGIDNVLAINQFAIDNVFPDLTFFLDLSPEEGLKRMKDRRRGADRLDQEKLDFHQKVYQGYQIINERFKDRIIKIDATPSPDVIADNIVSILLAKLKERKQQ